MAHGEQINHLKKAELEREIKLANVNVERLRVKWRDLIMKIQMPSIKEDVEAAWHAFERAVDYKDHRHQK